MNARDQQPALRVLTFQQPTFKPPVSCTGGYLCDCTDCTTRLNARLAQGVRRRELDQPWSSRKAA